MSEGGTTRPSQLNCCLLWLVVVLGLSAVLCSWGLLRSWESMGRAGGGVVTCAAAMLPEQNTLNLFVGSKSAREVMCT